MIADEQGLVAGEMTEEQEQQRLELEKTLLSMKATAQESSVHGKEALALAKAAEGKASTAMRVSEEQLMRAIERSISDESTHEHDELASNKADRMKAVEGTEAYAVHAAGTLLDQLELISAALLQSSTSAQ